MNTAGQLVGINSQILSPSGGNIGIGFAVPSGMAKNVMDQLVSNGRVQRGKLGVTVQGMTGDLTAHYPRRRGAVRPASRATRITWMDAPRQASPRGASRPVLAAGA